MLTVTIACLLLFAASTLLHYEVLRLLDARLPGMALPRRAKLLVIMFGAFIAHMIEICLYGIGLYLLVRYFDVGSISGSEDLSPLNYLYFSAETFTTLGFGDLTGVGPIRLVAGTESLNGLLLIGWPASYSYFGMERF